MRNPEFSRPRSQSLANRPECGVAYRLGRTIWPGAPALDPRANFTGFVYDLGFVLRLYTAIGRQAEGRYAKVPGAYEPPIYPIELTGSYAERIPLLRTSDHLFISNGGGQIRHIVIWVGPIGRSPDGVPLILDSHGEDVRDSESRPIPSSVQLWPFRENS